MSKRYKETRTIDKPGFMGGRTVESRVVEVGKDEERPAGAVETAEAPRDWAAEKVEGGRG